MNEQDKQFTTDSNGDDATLRLRPRVRTTRVSPVSDLQIPGWGLWAKWALASAILGLGPVGGILLAWATGQATFTQQGLKFQGEVLWEVFAFLIGCMLIALVTALAQWAVLRPYSLSLIGKEWVLTITTGYVLAAVFYVGSLLVAGAVVAMYAGLLYFSQNRTRTGGEEIGNAFTIVGGALLVAGVGASTIIGLAQRAALQNYLPIAKRLIVSNILAALIYELSVLLIGYVISGEAAITKNTLWNTVLLGWEATLLLSGTITGVTLLRLLRRPQAERTLPG